MRTPCLLCTVLLLGACGTKIDAVQQTSCTSAAPVTFDRDIKPWAAEFCTRCHATTLGGGARAGAPPDVNLDTYAAAAASAASSDYHVQNGSMPPGPPKPTAAERETFHCWVEQGAKEN